MNIIDFNFICGLALLNTLIAIVIALRINAINARIGALESEFVRKV